MKKQPIVILLLACFTLGTLFTSCQKEGEKDSTSNTTSNESEKQPSLDDLFEEDKEGEQSTTDTGEAASEKEGTGETLEDLFGEDETGIAEEDVAPKKEKEAPKAPVAEAKKEKEKPATTSTRSKAELITPKTSPSSYSNDEVARPVSIRDQKAPHYLVLAGTFLNLMNAEREAARLQALGFDNAEVRQFDLSEYHIVVAGRFEALPPARKMARDLVNKAGVGETYVHRQRSKFFGNSPFEEEPVYQFTKP